MERELLFSRKSKSGLCLDMLDCLLEEPEGGSDRDGYRLGAV